MVKEILKTLSSPIFMTFLLVLLIVSLAGATFIENDFGSTVARFRVYNAAWFELVLLLLAVNLTARAIVMKLYKVEKFSVFLFHIAFVLMIVGAGITRYFGEEGTMHIREGKQSSTIIVNERVFDVKVLKNNTLVKEEQFKSAVELRRVFNEHISVEQSKIDIKLLKYYEKVVKRALPHNEGAAIAGFVLSSEMFRGFDYVSFGETKVYGDFSISFDPKNGSLSDLVLSYIDDVLYLSSPYTINVQDMGSEVEGGFYEDMVPAEPRKIYTINNHNFVLQEFYPYASFKPSMPDAMGQGMKAMVLTVGSRFEEKEIVLFEDEWNGEHKFINMGEYQLGISYGNRKIELPFSLFLNDFVIERYPGSSSPSSFSSYVTIIDETKEPEPYHIFMNNILKYHGYRFFQSSYDQDEQGTILSVNYDKWGTGITYFSYFLLILGMLWSMINPKTFFRRTVLNQKLLPMILLLMLLFPAGAFAQGNKPTSIQPVDKKHAEAFGMLHVQNYKGRTEPMFTYSSELLRKIVRAERFNGLTPTQVFLEMSTDPGRWMDIPMIKVTNRELQSLIGVNGKYAAYSDFISPHQGYVLQNAVSKVYAKPAAQRDKFDKAVMKTDEKINICYAIYTGSLLKVLPVPGNPEPTKWYPPSEAAMLATSAEDSLFLSSIVEAYFIELIKAKQTADYTIPNQLLNQLIAYQAQNAGYELPSELKTKIEVFYQKLNAFKKLFPFYFSFGLLNLFMLITFIVIGKNSPSTISRIFYFAMLAGFVVHTVGLSARWYISGHAPMSNGYESMVFISWVTVLSGFIFNRRSPFALTATAVLAGLTLMVANLSFMDPDVTNLVPVLQSYWLTIHVSVITASYGFLGLGALIGIINQILVIFLGNRNKDRIIKTIHNLTIINHKTMIIGLYLLTIGTFLGAVWANESWGRYWGWDPKETWALISILVYTIVTHARLIPGLKGIFTLNVLSLYAFASIMMTYFGVNYYLSGLHSYAGGDPVPVPAFVYYTVAAFVLLTLTASIRFDKLNKKQVD
jgi:cytochrome c-type biogenesis protein CcsB